MSGSVAFSVLLLAGGTELRFQADARPHLVIVAAEDEYKTEETLPKFVAAHLGQDFRVTTLFGDAKSKHRIPGIEAIKTADVLLLSVRRRPLVQDQLQIVRDYVASGKPVAAIRTSSHAFAPRKGEKLPAGVAEWPTFDQDVLGCRYTGHFSNKLKTTLAVADGKHPVLAGVDPKGFASTSWLYKSNPLAKDATLLLTGTAGDSPPEPAAWVREPAVGRGRVFYTCLGHVDDFKDANFVALLKNGLLWAAGVRK